MQYVGWGRKGEFSNVSPVGVFFFLVLEKKSVSSGCFDRLHITEYGFYLIHSLLDTFCFPQFFFFFAATHLERNEQKVFFDKFCVCSPKSWVRQPSCICTVEDTSAQCTPSYTGGSRLIRTRLMHIKFEIPYKLISYLCDA